MFEQKTPETSVKPQKDPALLSLADRKALFEKNKGEALVPKAAFGMSAPVKVDTTAKACESKFIGVAKNKENVVQQHRSRIEANKGPVIVSETVKVPQQPSKPNYASSSSKCTPPPPPPSQQFKPATSSTSKVASLASVTVPTVAAVYQAGGIASKMAALLENKNKATISEEQIANKMKQERQKELDMLLNRFNQNKQVNYSFFVLFHCTETFFKFLTPITTSFLPFSKVLK